MKNDILVVGSVAFDTIENANGCAKRVLGGAASYASICASYYAHPSIVAVVGTDFTAADRSPFVKRKVDLKGLEVKKGKLSIGEASTIKISIQPLPSLRI